MPRPSKRWSFRRWRRRWSERTAALALRWRIWFDRHVISYERRREWRRRWSRRSKKISGAVENVGFKVLPHRPDAAPDTRWTRLAKRFNAFIDERMYPPAARVRHGRALRAWWHEFTAPFRHANMAVRRWLGQYLLPALTPTGFRKQFFNWKGAAGGVTLIALGCGICFWAIPQWSRHNEHKRAAQARLLLNRGYQTLAAQFAVRVLQQNEHNEEACRVFADLYERQGRADAVLWRRKVVDSADSVTNRLALAAAAVKFEPPPSATASRVLNELEATAAHLPQYHVVAAQFDVRNGNLRAAEEHYLAALAQEPDNSENILSLALIRLQTRGGAPAALAESALLSLADQPDMSVRALRPLVVLTASRGDFETALSYSERILANEASTFEDRVTQLDVLFRKRDGRAQVFLRTLQDQVSANPGYVAQLASWMTAQGQARAARTWIETLPPSIRRADPVLIATSYAYVADADWHGLEQFLQAERRGWGTIEFVRQALLARAYRSLGERRAFADNFERAKDLASGMVIRLTRLTQLVAEWGWTNEVDELLWVMFDQFPTENWAADSLLKRYYERGDTDGISRVFTQQLKRQPNDVPLKNNLAMALLLLNRDLPKAHQLAAEAHQKSPESAVHTSTYAFSLYRQGRAAEARKVMDTLGPETLKVPSLAAYYAMICAATGDPDAARRHADYARHARLLPEERALLESIRNKL